MTRKGKQQCACICVCVQLSGYMQDLQEYANLQHGAALIFSQMYLNTDVLL